MTASTSEVGSPGGASLRAFHISDDRVAAGEGARKIVYAMDDGSAVAGEDDGGGDAGGERGMAEGDLLSAWGTQPPPIGI